MGTASEQQEDAARTREGSIERDADEAVPEAQAPTREAVEQERRDRAVQALA